MTTVSKLDLYLLRVVVGGAILFALLTIVGLALSTISLAVDDELRITGMPYTGEAEVRDAPPALVQADVSSADATVVGLDGGARGLLIAERLAEGLPALGICAAVALVGLRVLDGRPFVRSATWAVGLAGVFLMVGGLLQPAFAAYARAAVVDFLGPQAVTAGGDQSGSYPGFTRFVMLTDLSPIGWGLALAVVATAFELGRRMQRETDTLV
ncbi:hypothetical protein [Desertivibrio insolitus]|uniref:hypothetical protein n=1 Tax=Herbiconiux sp. SYSU D00978 TaxID=2812562 RepID=UPI001A958B71|nr:hypothetical protein [Herbiconiux sp. SYSU D00978]